MADLVVTAIDADAGRLANFIDVHGLGLRVTRDGEYFQHVVVVASGQVQALQHADLFEDPLVWRAAVSVALDAIRDAATANLIPLAVPQDPYYIEPNWQLVRSTLDAMSSTSAAAGFGVGEIVGTITL